MDVGFQTWPNYSPTDRMTMQSNMYDSTECNSASEGIMQTKEIHDYYVYVETTVSLEVTQNWFWCIVSKYSDTHSNDEDIFLFIYSHFELLLLWDGSNICDVIPF